MGGGPTQWRMQECMQDNKCPLHLDLVPVTQVYEHTQESPPATHSRLLFLIYLKCAYILFSLLDFFFKSRQSLTVSHFTRLTSKVKSPISVS